MGYCSVEELRDEGVTTEMAADPRLVSLIALETARIDRVTRQFFEPRELVLTLDSDGVRRLQFDVPIVAIAAVRFFDTWEALQADPDRFTVDPAEYIVYNRHLVQGLLAPDDRHDPRIEFMRRGSNWLSTGGVYVPTWWARRWPQGQQNVVVEGTFGYTDPDPAGTSVEGLTPLLIKHACKLLVMKQLPKMADRDARRAEFTRNRVMEERTRDQSYRLGDAGAGVRMGGASGYLTGDEEVDQILEHFMRPLVIGHT
jgi:hypothetical protein